MLPPWPPLAPAAAANPTKRHKWISERVTQLLVYLDNIDIQQKDCMRQHRRSLVRQLQQLASEAQLLLRLDTAAAGSSDSATTATTSKDSPTAK